MSHFLDGGDVTIGDVIFAVILIGLLVVGAFFIRHTTIENCRERGGAVVEHPIYSRSYWAPGCVTNLPAG